MHPILDNLPTESLCTVEGLPFPHLKSGKVREIYDLGEPLLIVATDRVSAFDVVLANGIPGKGILLNQLSLFCFQQTAACVPNHLVPDHSSVVAERLADHPHLIPRSMVVRKLEPLPIEMIVRGYLSGSGWKCYQKTGRLFEYDLPPHLRENDRLPKPLLTPTTKAQSGHDEPITAEAVRTLLGTRLFQQLHTASLKLFQTGSRLTKQAGFILADTKFEFGRDADKKLYLIDELFTPDASRYWQQALYRPGRPQQFFDKQYIRDFLEQLQWDKTPPAPPLPEAVITATQKRYLEVVQRFISIEKTKPIDTC